MSAPREGALAVTAIFHLAASGPWARDAMTPFYRMLAKLRRAETRTQRGRALADREYELSGHLDGGGTVHLAISGGLLTVTLATPNDQLCLPQTGKEQGVRRNV